MPWTSSILTHPAFFARPKIHCEILLGIAGVRDVLRELREDSAAGEESGCAIFRPVREHSDRPADEVVAGAPLARRARAVTPFASQGAPRATRRPVFRVRVRSPRCHWISG